MKTMPILKGQSGGVLGSGSKILTLEEIMERFRAHNLMAAINKLYTLLCNYKISEDNAIGDLQSGHLRETTEKMAGDFAALGLIRASEVATDVYLMCSDPDQVATMVEQAKKMPKYMNLLLNEISTALGRDMRREQFFRLSKEEFESMDAQSHPFGEKVHRLFPSAHVWVLEAKRCLVFECWSASVTESLKVVEFGVQRLAKRSGLSLNNPNSSPISWHLLLCDVEKKVTKFRSNGTKTQDRFAENAAMAVSFLLLAKTVRNAADHPKRPFTEGEAYGVFDSASHFMKALPPLLLGAKRYLAPIPI